MATADECRVGSAPVTLTGFSVSPADGTFTQTNNCPATLAIQQSCAVQIVFTPPDVFTYSATVSVANGAGLVFRCRYRAQDWMVLKPAIASG